MLRRGNKLSKLWARLKTSPRTVPVLVLVFVTVVLFMTSSNRQADSSFSQLSQKWNSFPSSVKFEPVIDYPNGTEIISQIPTSPKAVLFLAHGCGGKAPDWWDKSEKCSICVGLPEERLIVLHALSRNFAVLTISSAEKCWTFEEEIVKVKNIIEWWVEKNNLQKLPLTGLGASSGGYFLSALASDMKFKGITVMIASGIFNANDLTINYPPTLFVHMPKDRRTKKMIVKYMESLKRIGIDVADIECMKIPLSSTTFSDRIPGINQAVSTKLFELFQQKGFIDNMGYMKSDGREVNWKEALKGNGEFSSVSELTRHIQEEMNLAYAYHEMTSLHMDQILDWFSSHLK